MSTLSRIEKEYIAAYKAKQSDVVGVLRMLKAAIKNRQVDLGQEPDEQQVLDILNKQLKQRVEAAEQFEKAGRDELARKEKAEAAVIKQYLPALLTTEELSAAVEQAIHQTSPAGPQDMGKVMSALMQQYKGRMDGKEASAMVKSRLAP